MFGDDSAEKEYQKLLQSYVEGSDPQVWGELKKEAVVNEEGEAEAITKARGTSVPPHHTVPLHVWPSNLTQDNLPQIIKKRSSF